MLKYDLLITQCPFQIKHFSKKKMHKNLASVSNHKYNNLFCWYGPLVSRAKNDTRKLLVPQFLRYLDLLLNIQNGHLSE